MKTETVEQYLARGGTIKRVTHVNERLVKPDRMREIIWNAMVVGYWDKYYHRKHLDALANMYLTVDGEWVFDERIKHDTRD